jgi:hypothetical protein
MVGRWRVSRAHSLRRTQPISKELRSGEAGRPASRPRRRLRALLACGALALGCALRPPAPDSVFRVSIVDAETGRGIPAVELRTTDARSYFSDSAGVVALGDPPLMNRSVFFEVRSFGYRFEEGIEHWRGVTLEVAPGRATVLQMQRENVAQRLYRVTGTGIYRDSLLAGTPVPFQPPAREPVPAGADSAFTAVYRGKLYWVWGDTAVLSRPIGIFRGTGAISHLPRRGGIDPETGIDFRYLRDGSELRAVVDDPHPVIWLSALRAARDSGGTERLFATYCKIVGFMDTAECGLAEFDDRKAVFRVVSPYPAEAPIVPDGHVFRYAEDGTAYLQYDMHVRSRDAAEAVRDLSSYEAFTPMRPGARLADGAAALERDASGRLVWGWKRDAPRIPHAAWDALEASGAVAPGERPYRMIDVETGETIVPHHGSIHWNEYRRRWVMIRGQRGGASSAFGEIYYFEGDTPLGPWAYGRKIITHSRNVIEPGLRSVRETYSFYNPMQHPEFDRDGGREIFLEGTLSLLFAEPAAPRIPAYDYNQMMYKLSLDDPRLFLPVPVYLVPGDPPTHLTRDALLGEAAREPSVRLPAEIAFFAPDRPRAGTVPVREAGGASPRLVAGEAEQAEPVRFHCAPDESPATVPLYERSDGRGRFTYTTEAPSEPAAILCHVWPAPVDFETSLPWREPPPP